MKIREILNGPRAKLYTVTPNGQLAAVARTMADAEIGAITVVEDGQVAGLVTQMDILKALSAHGGALGHALVAAWMDETPITCSPDSDIATLRRSMLAKNSTHAPVVDHGCIVGVVTIGDLALAEQSQQDARDGLSLLRSAEALDGDPAREIQAPHRDPHACLDHDDRALARLPTEGHWI